MILFLPYGLGDTLMAVPALRRLVSVRGVDGVTVVTSSAIHRHILRVFVDPAMRTIESNDGGRWAPLRLFARMLTSSASTIAAPMLSPSLGRYAFMLMLGRTVHVPTSFTRHSRLWLHRSKFLLKDFEGHQVDYFVQFLSVIEPRMDSRPVDPFELAPLAATAVERVPSTALVCPAAARRFRIVVGTSCGVPERHKIPSPVGFAKLINALARRVDIELLLIGSPADRPLIDALRAGLDPALSVSESIGQPIESLIATMRECHLGICGTTGQGHMMAAAGLPMLVLAGVTRPAESGPFVRRAAVLRHRFACGPCYQHDFRFGCGRFACMETLDVDEGATLACRMLEEPNFGADWLTTEAEVRLVPPHVINQIHQRPVGAWISPKENHE